MPHAQLGKPEQGEAQKGTRAVLMKLELRAIDVGAELRKGNSVISTGCLDRELFDTSAIDMEDGAIDFPDVLPCLDWKQESFVRAANEKLGALPQGCVFQGLPPTPLLLALFGPLAIQPLQNLV